MPGMVLKFQQFSNLLKVTRPLRDGARKKDHSYSLVLEGRHSPMFRSYTGGRFWYPDAKHVLIVKRGVLGHSKFSLSKQRQQVCFRRDSCVGWQVGLNAFQGPFKEAII